MNDTVITCSVCDHIYHYIHKILDKMFSRHNDTDDIQHHNHHNHRNHRNHHNHHIATVHMKEVELIKNKYINKFVCGICLDSNEGICMNHTKNYKFITPCGHIFHKQCLRKWWQTHYKKKCPTCRAKIAHYKIFL
jgi:hypothetical protein